MGCHLMIPYAFLCHPDNNLTFTGVSTSTTRHTRTHTHLPSTCFHLLVKREKQQSGNWTVSPVVCFLLPQGLRSLGPSELQPHLFINDSK